MLIPLCRQGKFGGLGRLGTSFRLSLGIFRGRERQWAPEGGEGSAEFPLWPLFFLACLSRCQRVHAELGLGPGRGQSQGGPSSLPARRRCHSCFRAWQAWGIGLSALHIPLAGKALEPLSEPWPCWPLRQIPGAPPPAQLTLGLHDPEPSHLCSEPQTAME